MRHAALKAFQFQIAQQMGADIDFKANRTEDLNPLAQQQLCPGVKLMVDASSEFENFSHARQVVQLLINHNYP